MQMTKSRESILSLVNDFKDGDFKEYYVNDEKRFLIEFMFTKVKDISSKFNKSYSFEVETTYKRKEVSKNILEPDMEKIRITLKDEIFTTDMESVFSYIRNSILLNKISYISNLMESKNKEGFYETLNLINNTKN